MRISPYGLAERVGWLRVAAFVVGVPDIEKAVGEAIVADQIDGPDDHFKAVEEVIGLGKERQLHDHPRECWRGISYCQSLLHQMLGSQAKGSLHRVGTQIQEKAWKI